MIALADHFEPAIVPDRPGDYAPEDEQQRRVEAWCRVYPQCIDRWRDADGHPFKHTYFFPAEQYEAGLLDCLAELCREGWGELEIQLHHGLKRPDTAANTRRVLLEFRDSLVGRGCLSRWDGNEEPRYAFVHGNWALANSKQGRFCGVDEELKILAETGCYADMTLPSAPDSSQITRINSIYECALPLHQRAAHRRGRDLVRGRPPTTFPLIVQGPLGLKFSKRGRGLPLPRIENGALFSLHPPSLSRFKLWCEASIHVSGMSDWFFVKLYCHGMDPRDEEVMLGETFRSFLSQLIESTRDSSKYRLHFVSAREMVNIILAACDGHEGNPDAFRDYRLKLIREACRSENGQPVSTVTGLG